MRATSSFYGTIQARGGELLKFLEASRAGAPGVRQQSTTPNRRVLLATKLISTTNADARSSRYQRSQLPSVTLLKRKFENFIKENLASVTSSGASTHPH